MDLLAKAGKVAAAHDPLFVCGCRTWFLSYLTNTHRPQPAKAPCTALKMVNNNKNLRKTVNFEFHWASKKWVQPIAHCYPLFLLKSGPQSRKSSQILTSLRNFSESSQRDPNLDCLVVRVSLGDGESKDLWDILVQQNRRKTDWYNENYIYDIQYLHCLLCHFCQKKKWYGYLWISLNITTKQWRPVYNIKKNMEEHILFGAKQIHVSMWKKKLAPGWICDPWWPFGNF